ncbi:ATPase [Prevotella communis]|uniref:ATPase n=1 Tax=Prevotella communis TaxID=2913614 RepID=UPI001EDA05DB|nr:ATPase [Prevotella communis]UKK62341.1 ATPase [Prevotella communis]UKK65168.1 ATPase [Prevotella communis]
MNPVYIDIHIHTSPNHEEPNKKYDTCTLLAGVDRMAQGADALISLTDHNMINKAAYLALLANAAPQVHVLLGVELNIKNYEEAPSYHCHIIFDCATNEENIDAINGILDELYPKKRIERDDKNIPDISRVINAFDSFDFLLLPHGGQSHATFDHSIPRGVKFDTTLMRSIYYNQFDGFTARTNAGLEETERYFKRLGINEFVNLVTCSDNYEPHRYPEGKDHTPFMPTWMFAEPTFDGLRLSLSEKTRFLYSEQRPSSWSEYIKSVRLKGDGIDIDIQLTPGLNVIIGGSSSGKTLLVDSIYRKLCEKSFADSEYEKFRVSNIEVYNPSSTQPHFLPQNYIIKIIDPDAEKGIENIEIIRNVFPENAELKLKVADGITKLREDMTHLMNCVEEIEKLEEQLRKIPSIGRLIIKGTIKRNILSSLVPSADVRATIHYDERSYNEHKNMLDEIRRLFVANPFAAEHTAAMDEILNELHHLYSVSEIESSVYQTINAAKRDYEEILSTQSYENQQKNQNQETLLDSITKYIELQQRFREILNSISIYSISVETKEITSMGHHLFLQNDFKLTKEKVLETFNECLKSQYAIAHFQDITPQSLVQGRFSQRAPKICSYNEFIEKVVEKFSKLNKTLYRINTKDGKSFDELSAGWKTSVLLDLVLDYDKDMVPIIIDQPEDNLASAYINDGLVKAIKKTKTRKQIILVSHNATIPMLADAQNIVYCKNENGFITIRSSSLEGKIDGVPVLDLIAKITDGGKTSVKKRVKKYNLKKFTD